MDFFTALRDELDTQQRLQKLYTDRLSSMPEGTLWTKRRKDGNQYYLKLPALPPKYLNKKSNGKLISQLKSKQFLANNLCRINHNIPLLSELSSSYIPLFTDAVCKPVDYTGSENAAYPEALIFSTHFGLKVRSKSEAMIADALYTFQVPQFYERKLVLADSYGKQYDIYPDFTIPLPDGSYIYWEHKGLMNDPKYRQRNQWKESLYFTNGIYPPHNLIITMDGPNQEFDVREIHRIIKGLILPRLGRL
ncbi:MAG: hypothetical protein IJB73_04915 [Firmicutes bacterium]|nr:hypothetical protein [Bacillota bacterium]